MAIFAWPGVLSDQPERGQMSLHDAVGVNCKKGTTTQNQGAGVKCMG